MAITFDSRELRERFTEAYGSLKASKKKERIAYVERVERGIRTPQPGNFIAWCNVDETEWLLMDEANAARVLDILMECPDTQHLYNTTATGKMVFSKGSWILAGAHISSSGSTTGAPTYRMLRCALVRLTDAVAFVCLTGGDGKPLNEMLGLEEELVNLPERPLKIAVPSM